MSGRIKRIETVRTPASAPKYELRVRSFSPGDTEIEIWQLRSPATPHLAEPVRVAGLHGRNLELVENRVLKRLAQAGVRFGLRAGGAPAATRSPKSSH